MNNDHSKRDQTLASPSESDDPGDMDAIQNELQVESTPVQSAACEQITTRYPRKMLDEIEEFADGEPRSYAIRQLVKLGLRFARERGR